MEERVQWMKQGVDRLFVEYAHYVTKCFEEGQTIAMVNPRMFVKEIAGREQWVHYDMALSFLLTLIEEDEAIDFVNMIEWSED